MADSREVKFFISDAKKPGKPGIFHDTAADAQAQVDRLQKKNPETKLGVYKHTTVTSTKIEPHTGAAKKPATKAAPVIAKKAADGLSKAKGAAKPAVKKGK
jgi:hypothetical protein